jgi:hypothetical protein
MMMATKVYVLMTNMRLLVEELDGSAVSALRRAIAEVKLR